MPKGSTRLGRLDVNFSKEMQRIAKIRFVNGLDKRYSTPRVQRKILRHKSWQTISQDLERATFIEDERGQVPTFSLFTFMIVAFIGVLFFGGLIYVTGLLNSTFQEVGLMNEANADVPGYVNLTQAANNTFGKMNESIQGLRLVAVTLIFSQILLFIVVCSFRKIHPAMFFVHVLIVFLAVMFAAPIANAYEDILQSGIYEGNLETFSATNWIILHLPVVVLLMGLLGGIFMFINIVRSGTEEAL